MAARRAARALSLACALAVLRRGDALGPHSQQETAVRSVGSETGEYKFKEGDRVVAPYQGKQYAGEILEIFEQEGRPVAVVYCDVDKRRKSKDRLFIYMDRLEGVPEGLEPKGLGVRKKVSKKRTEPKPKSTKGLLNKKIKEKRKEAESKESGSTQAEPEKPAEPEQQREVEQAGLEIIEHSHPDFFAGLKINDDSWKWDAAWGQLAAYGDPDPMYAGPPDTNLGQLLLR